MLGKKFHKWLVIQEIKTDKPGKHYECKCNCGNINIIPGTTLRANRSKQCRDCQYKQLYDPQKMIGQKHGKWKVIEFIKIHRNLQHFKIQCECGFVGKIAGADLRCGKSKQCTNCHNRENAENNKTHGMHNSKLYKVWTSMIQRCNNPNNAAYKYYGKRGIKINEKWLKFENFYKDMGERPDGMTLDRINNDGNYEPGNCRWTTHIENCNNRRKKYTLNSRLSLSK